MYITVFTDNNIYNTLKNDTHTFLCHVNAISIMTAQIFKDQNYQPPSYHDKKVEHINVPCNTSTTSAMPRLREITSSNGSWSGLNTRTVLAATEPKCAVHRDRNLHTNVCCISTQRHATVVMHTWKQSSKLTQISNPRSNVLFMIGSMGEIPCPSNEVGT